MSDAYEEVIDGETLPRRAPDAPHELLTRRLHHRVAAALPLNSTLHLVGPRQPLELAADCVLCPDLALVRIDASGTNHLYLIAEVLQPGDHQLDTVVKKQIWSDARLPRLWMIDPRYLNVEIYGRGEYGFTLQHILAHREPLTDPYLPGFSVPMDELFAGL